MLTRFTATYPYASSGLNELTAISFVITIAMVMTIITLTGGDNNDSADDDNFKYIEIKSCG